MLDNFSVVQLSSTSCIVYQEPFWASHHRRIALAAPIRIVSHLHDHKTYVPILGSENKPSTITWPQYRRHITYTTNGNDKLRPTPQHTNILHTDTPPVLMTAAHMLPCMAHIAGACDGRHMKSCCCTVHATCKAVVAATCQATS